MAKTSVELREERATVIAEARKSWEEAEARDGGPTEADKQAFDKAMDGADELLERAKRIERLEVASSDLDAPQDRQSRPLDSDERERRHDGQRGEAAEAAKRQAFRHWLKTGEARGELREERDRARSPEFRDTIISTDAKGGYLIAPTQISADIVSIIRDLVFIRALCEKAGSVTTVTDAKKLGIRKKTAHMADADWTTEVAGVTEDTTMAFGLRELEPQLVSKLAKVSVRTLLLSADAESEINGELGYKFGVTEEKAFLTGDGSGKPLGIFTASANGISTGRDVAAASATAVAGDDLINVKYALKAPYRRDPSCAWAVSRELVKRVRKLKVASSTGGNDLEYLWQPGLTDGQPDRILDLPYFESEYAPATFTTGLYVAVLGCFRFYRIAQVASMMIQRLVERYADTNEVGFIGRRWVDGAPVLEEAFSRLKLA